MGDQASCVTIRGAKRRRINDINPLQRLTWAHENPGDLHFLWECMKVVFLLFWGNSDEPGSLAHLKSMLNRGKVDKEAKNFQAADEFLHNTGVLLSGITHLLSWS